MYNLLTLASRKGIILYRYNAFLYQKKKGRQTDLPKPSQMKRNLFTKLVLLVLVLCLVLCAGLVSCGKNDTDKPAGAETEHKNNVETLTPENALSLDGYAIVRADKAKKDIKNVVVTLHEAIQKATGLNLKKATDFSGSQSKEIHVGNTKRASTDSLKMDQYQITRQGDKIAILGGSDEAVINGVNYFIENLICENGLILADGYNFTSATKYTVTGLKIGGADVNAVYVKNELDADNYAESILSVVANRIGITAEMSKSAEKVNVIVTNDQSLGITEGSWGLVVKEGKLYVIGTTDYEQKAAFNYMVNLINNTNGVLAFNDGVVHSEKLITKEEYYKDTQLVIYPEFPQQIRRNYDYQVTVHQGDKSGKIPVYNHTMEYRLTDRAIGGDNYRRFATFAFSGEQVRVDIKVTRDFESYSVIPSAKNFKSEFKDGVISVYLDKPDYFMIRLDNDVNSLLAVAADYPEYPGDVPSKDGANVYYVEGWVEPEQGLLKLDEPGTTLYIAPGSVLNARCKVTGAFSQVLGRGAIVDPYENIREYDGRVAGSEGSGWNMLSMTGVNSKFDGPFLLDARCFNLALNASNIEVYNYKALSTMMTTDGISLFGGKNHYIEHCINYTGDNSFVYSTEGSYIKDSITGTTCAIIFPQGNSNNVTFENIYVIRADDGFINNRYNPGEGEMNHNAKFINCDAMDCVNLPHFFQGRGMGMEEKPFYFDGISLPALSNSGNPHKTSLKGNAYRLVEIINGSGYIETGNYYLEFNNLYIEGELIEDAFVLNNQGNEGYHYYLSFSADGKYTPVRPNTKVVNYQAELQVYVGARQINFADDIVVEGGKYYLPAAEMLKALRSDKKVETKDIGGVEYAEASQFVAVKAADDLEIADGDIRFTAVTPRSNILFPEDGEISQYADSGAWMVDLVYAIEDGEETFYMYARNNQYGGGLSRDITEEIQTYGEGTYTLSYMIRSEDPASVSFTINYDTPEKLGYLHGTQVIPLDNDWQMVTATFDVTEDMLEKACWYGFCISGKSDSPTSCYVIKNIVLEK